MKKYRIIGIILFLATFFSPIIAFNCIALIGEVETFGIAGLLRYSWIMLLFIPLGVLSVMIGFKLKRSNLNYRKNFVIAIICIPVLLTFGSYRFIFNNAVSYDTDKVYSVESKTGVDLPHQVKIATLISDTEIISRLKITNPDEKKSFENEIKNNNLWKTPMSTRIISLLPYSIDLEVDNFDCYVFYNSTTGEYNTYPIDGEYMCTFIAYHYETQTLIIVEDFYITIN